MQKALFPVREQSLFKMEVTMDRKLLLWLQKEMNKWISKGWITPDSADAIQAYYGTIGESKRPSLLRLLVVLIGAVLISLGIFLLFAGYWYGFSPNGRFDWILALVAISLLVVALAIGTGKPGGTLQDISGVVYFFTIGVSSWLLGDTYYLGNSYGLYLLITVVLSLPVAYLLDSPILMSLYVLGAALWSMTNQAIHFYTGPSFVWVLLLAAVPYYRKLLREPHRESSKVILSWSCMTALYGAFFFTIVALESNLTILYLTGLAVMTYGVGRLRKSQGFWTLPFRTIGLLGLLYVAFSATFLARWQRIAAMTSIGVFDILFVLAFTAITIYMMIALGKKKYYLSMCISTLFFVVLGCAVLAQLGLTPLVISVIFNIGIITLVGLAILRGTMIHDVSLVNGAVVAILAIVLARFFDPGFTFVERGISFILVGIIMIVANILYMWNKGRENKLYNKKVRSQERRKVVDTAEENNAEDIGEPMVRQSFAEHEGKGGQDHHE